MKLKISVVKMEHKRLYEIKIEQLEKENQELKLKLEKQDLIKEGYKEEISKWNKKYKDLKKQITNG
jgi:hypothetical protein